MTAAASAADVTSRAMRLPRRRRKWDKQPSQPAAVLVASIGVPIPDAVLLRAEELADGAPVAVVSIARIYGSSLGLPNPGLMPTRAELSGQRELVDAAVRRLERDGYESWGQVAATRRFAKTIAEAARARKVGHVLVVSAGTARWRRAVEGDVARDVGRRIGRQMIVESIVT